MSIKNKVARVADVTKMGLSSAAEVTVLAIFIGIGLVVLALLPGFKFYEGRLGTKQSLPAIESAWIGRLVIFIGGLAVILDGIWEIHHH